MDARTYTTSQNNMFMAFGKQLNVQAITCRVFKSKPVLLCVLDM